MKKLISFSSISHFVIIISILWTMFNIRFWKQERRVIYWDVLEYYSYLPAAFIYNDLTMKFTDSNPIFSDKIWAFPLKNGNKVVKMSSGLSLLYLPFFLTSHLAAKILNYPATGWGEPYAFGLLMSSVFYLALGLYFLRKVLRKYFSDFITAVTLISVVIGTNLFYYSAFEAAMSHSFSFSMFCAFIYFTIFWYEKPTFKNSFIIGLLAGIISLIRPTNSLIILFFLFWKIDSFESLKLRVKFFIEKFKLIFLIIFGGILIWIPQLLYWKIVTGQWFFYSYMDNNFYFSKPHVLDGLFSFRKGWLLYTPMMIFAIFGITLLFKRLRDFFVPTLTFFIVNIYIIFSWWCWWYGGSFGMRPLIESYALLAIPMATVLENLLSKKNVIKIAFIFLIFLLNLHSIFQTAKYYYGSIHWDAMTEEAYFHCIDRVRPDGEFYKLIKSPDYENAKKGLPEK